MARTSKVRKAKSAVVAPVAAAAPRAPRPTLDTVLTRFVVLDTTDAGALNAFRQLLWQVSAAPDCAPDVRMHLADAILLIDDAAAFRGANAAASAEALRAMLERAAGIISDAPTPQAAAPVVAAAPASSDPAAPRRVELQADADTSLVADFVMESFEYLAKAEAALLTLEHDAVNDEAINDVFRAVHTIKGTSAFLGLSLIADFTHHAETVLMKVRARELKFEGAVADLSLRALDCIRALVTATQAALDKQPAPAPHDYESLLREVERAASGEFAARPAASADVRAAAAPAADAPEATHAATRSGADAFVRVRTERVDKLVEMIGELVIAHAMIAEDLTGQHEQARNAQHAQKIVRELQDLSMGMRMVPVRNATQRLPRLVRDLAQKMGKAVNFHAEGEDTEIDRALVDVLGDPLVHMVRNSIDHGLESAADRVAAGKPEAGSIRIDVSHAGGDVVVKLEDDGRGLSRERILAKAVANGLVQGSGESLTDAEVFAFIFAPGFSTAAQVTDVSGRGVGMDVVNRAVQAVRGRIEIASQAGKGTTFTLRLPLTLALTDGMLVRVGGERYIIPIYNIRMTLRPETSALSTAFHRGEMVQHGGASLPMIRLHRAFRVAGAVERPEDAALVIVDAGSERVALLVDEILGQQQVVAKPLGDAIGRVPGLAGGAILGDGRVGLVLDVAELATVARAPAESLAA